MTAYNPIDPLTTNNVAVPNLTYVKISKNTSMTIKNSIIREQFPGIDLNNIMFVTFLGDSSHDETFVLGVKKPADLENNMVLNTYVISLKNKIPQLLSFYGENIVYSKTGTTPKQIIPYSIPNNNQVCYIRDCFDGTWIPGLNNIFDQATASLKSFIEYHSNSQMQLKNPLFEGSGGIGQQLMKKNSDNNNFLKYTAYFNFDLLMFVYITTVVKPVEPTNSLIEKVKTIISTTSSNVLLTPKEIILINTVNINYVWCNLMIYCDMCIKEDEYFMNNTVLQVGFREALKALTQIRFDGFATNNDGYISNPYFYYRGNPAAYVLKDEYSYFQGYIDELCSGCYSGYNIDFGTLDPKNSTLSGGVEYITSQSMAATCMTSILGKITGLICRNEKQNDAAKIASMTEIDKLFNVCLGAKSKDIAYGWCILKFSGDSSHIVFGEIMEWIKKWDAGTMDDGTNKKYLDSGFKIVYAVQERPLAARLLAASKTVFVAMTDVFITNFNGPGSENKTDGHAALYIEFNKEDAYVSIIDGLYDKIKKVGDDSSNYPKANISINANATEMNDNIDRTTVEKLAYINSKLLSELPTPPTSEKSSDVYYDTFQTNFQTNEKIKAFLNSFDIDTLKININSKLQQISSSLNNFDELAKCLIATKWISVRSTTKTNWYNLMVSLESEGKNTITTEQNTQNQQFQGMRELISLFYEFYITKEQNDEFVLFKKAYSVGAFKVIFDKMYSANTSPDKIAQFKENRESDWNLKKKGNSEKLPSKVLSIIDQLESFMNNCIALYNQYDSSGISNEPPSKRRKIGGVYKFEKGEKITATNEFNEEFKRVLTEITFDQEQEYKIDDLANMYKSIVTDDDLLTYNNNTEPTLIKNAITEKYADIIANRLKSLCGTGLENDSPSILEPKLYDFVMDNSGNKFLIFGCNTGEVYQWKYTATDSHPQLISEPSLDPININTYTYDIFQDDTSMSAANIIYQSNGNIKLKLTADSYSIMYNIPILNQISTANYWINNVFSKIGSTPTINTNQYEERILIKLKNVTDLKETNNIETKNIPKNDNSIYNLPTKFIGDGRTIVSGLLLKMFEIFPNFDFEFKKWNISLTLSDIEKYNNKDFEIDVRNKIIAYIQNIFININSLLNNYIIIDIISNPFMDTIFSIINKRTEISIMISALGLMDRINYSKNTSRETRLIRLIRYVTNTRQGGGRTHRNKKNIFSNRRTTRRNYRIIRSNTDTLQVNNVNVDTVKTKKQTKKKINVKKNHISKKNTDTHRR
jgi:hypothetical protein